MGITAYQISNVLRVYGEQLRRGRISNRRSSADTDESDKISISENARRESIADDITSDIIERITHPKLNDNAENKVLKKFESEHGKALPNNVSRYYELIFKEIDENGETINSFSLEDSKFLTNKLKQQKRTR